MGSVYRVGKTWYLSYFDSVGRRVRRSAHTQFKDAAKAALRSAELAVAKGEPIRPPIPLKDFLRAHLEAQRPTLTTITARRYQNCLINLLSHGSALSSLRLTEVTVGAVTEYVYWRLREGRARGTLQKEIGWLKRALREAACRDLLPWELVGRISEEVTVQRFPALRGTARRDRILFPHELTVLLEAAAGNHNLQDAVTVALWTGLRQRNVLELIEAQVDFSCEPAVVRFGQAEMKSRAAHVVYLPDQIKTILWRRWRGLSGARFFSDFRPAWKRLMRRLRGRVAGLRFHDLRRSYATYRLAAGIDPKTVQAELGHRDSRTTMDCYARAVRDPGIRAWAVQHFRFAYDAIVTEPSEQRATEVSKRDVTEQHKIR